MIRAVLSSRKLFSILILGFAGGLPLALTGATLQAWLKTEHVGIETIGLFSLVGLPYAFKFLWAPLVDRFAPPIWGRRRGWLLISQIGLVIGVLAMSLLSPGSHPRETAILAFLVAFLSATFDLVLDAYRTDVLEDVERGPGSALYVTGYRVAMITSGAAALLLADHLAWAQVYQLMAVLLGLCILATAFAPEPKNPPLPPRSLDDAILLPFLEFFKRAGAIETLLFVVLYRLDVVMASALLTPFLLDLKFSMTEIGAVAKGIGFAATIVGALAGGALMTGLGMKRSLWIFGLAQGLSTMLFWFLAHQGHHYPTMVAAIAVENFCSGMGTAAFSGFLMALCDRRYTATQYALLTGLLGMTRVLGGAPSGYLTQAVGWEGYFIVSTLAMVPGLLVLTRYDRWKLIKTT